MYTDSELREISRWRRRTVIYYCLLGLSITAIAVMGIMFLETWLSSPELTHTQLSAGKGVWGLCWMGLVVGPLTAFTGSLSAIS